MPRRINILGSGAIGGLCAAGAQKSNLPYCCSTRDQRPPLKYVEDMGGQITTLTPLPCNDEKLDNNDLLIVPLKAFQLEHALRHWQSRISPDTAVVLLHNGMGGIELARDSIPHNPVLLATTSHGALKLKADTVKHTGMGSTMLGMAFHHESATVLRTQIQPLMEACIGPVIWRDDMHTALWQKLLINCAINPLTALADVKNGELAHISYRPTLQAICEEVCLTAQACGIFMDADSALEQVLTVIENTANNYSSMHQDIAHKRPTEIDAINGYVVKQAQKKGIDVPVNTQMLLAIKAL